MGKLTSNHFGQSIVEYVVLLALVAIIIFTVVAGIGQRSQSRVAQANDALEEAAVASRTGASAASKGPVGGIAGKRPDGNH